MVGDPYNVALQTWASTFLRINPREYVTKAMLRLSGNHQGDFTRARSGMGHITRTDQVGRTAGQQYLPGFV